ncbi:GIY-YIG nuclease family protein [Aeromonas hydrophila]|uniref:GIY-YIG nuclease family protein n=1 Tax=Aeromonas hydrophila TaxID=644 RepID=UPI003985A266
MILLRESQYKPDPTLEDIFAEEDEFGLLDVEPIKRRSTPTDLVSSQFAEIMAFYELHRRVPQNDPSADFEERKLARRLQSMLSDPEQRTAIAKLEGDALIESISTEQEPSVIPAPSPAELVTSLEDIFADDSLGLLDFDNTDIFNLTHVPAEKKGQPDEIAQRQVCPEFHRYEPLFAQVNAGIKNNSITLERYRNHHGFKTGDFFVLSGVMGYVNSTGERLAQYDSYNARLHLVFENGTESQMLYQSLTQGLIRDKTGRKVMLGDKVLLPKDDPIPSGYIYVLATLSTNQVLNPYRQDLYKIGFTEGTVEDRIQHAEQDKTFLQAPVRIISTFQCFNMNTHKLETLVHGFLAKQRLDITLKSPDGSLYAPREWFNAPLATVLSVIHHILEGTISQYRMDNTTGKIVAKKLP